MYFIFNNDLLKAQSKLGIVDHATTWRIMKPSSTDQGVPSIIPIPDPSASDIAQYVEQITLELYHLARHKKLDLLAYFLTMANMEAQEQARADHNPG